MGMNTERIYMVPNEVLTKTAEPMSFETKEDQDAAITLADKLIVTMLRHSAQGLAAPQLGILSEAFCLRVNGQPHVFINPVIADKEEDLQLMSEGCLSLPNISIKLNIRHAAVLIEAMDQFNTPVKMELDGIEAIAFQHELDHLRGITILNHAKGFQKTLALQKLKKFRKQVRKSPGFKDGTSAFIL